MFSAHATPFFQADKSRHVHRVSSTAANLHLAVLLATSFVWQTAAADYLDSDSDTASPSFPQLQGETPDRPILGPTPAAIRQAIQQLESGSFRERQKASDFLWSSGHSAKPALTKALQSEDREVVMRARRILEQFRWGIFPDTPAQLLKNIQRFRGGNLAVKQAVISALLQESPATVKLLLANEPNETILDKLRVHLKRQSKTLVKELILRRDYDEVEEYLRPGGLVEDSALDYAVFLHQRGKAAEKAISLQNSTTEQSPENLRLLCYLLRLEGDLQAARTVAAQLNDPEFEFDMGIALVLRDWSDLYRLANRMGNPSKPVETNQAAAPANDKIAANRIQHLGVAAFCLRAQGKETQYEAAIQQIHQFAKAQPDHAWHSVEALLINEMYEEAIARFESHGELETCFRLLCARHDYERAFTLAGREEGQTLSDWTKSMVQKVTAEPATERKHFRISLQLARQLKLLGEDDLVASLLEQLVNAVRGDKSTDRLTQVCAMETQLGFRESAIQHAAITLAKDAHQHKLQSIYPKQSSLAYTWWKELEKRKPKATPIELLRQLDELLVPNEDSPTSQERLKEVFGEIMDQFVKSGDSRLYKWHYNFARTSELHGYDQLALSYYELAGGSSRESAMRLGDLAFEQKRWQQAARWYDSVWRQNDADHLALYLAGYAWDQAGQHGRGERAMTQASLLPLAQSTRYFLALGLQQRELTEAAEAQWNLVLNSNPAFATYANYAAQQLGNLLSKTDPLRATDLWQRYALHAFQTNIAFTDAESYLKLPHLIHRTRAVQLLDQGEPDKATIELKLALNAYPGSYSIPEELLRKMEDAGLKKEADEVYRQVFERNEAVCRAFPNSAYHRNNVAWMSARTNRNLPTALRMAQRAVELQPKNASYIDTLAEVHFCLADFKKAIQLAQRCLESEPDNEHFQEQLARFQSAKSKKAPK